MEAGELRIGNYVLIPYQNDQIAIPAHETQIQGITIFGEIITNSTPEREGLKTNFIHVSGIPTTEEWLLKFGFKQVYHRSPQTYGEKMIVYKKGQFAVTNQDYNSNEMVVTNSEELINWDWRHKCFEVKYIHTLQNIYFDFVKKELTIQNQL